MRTEIRIGFLTLLPLAALAAAGCGDGGGETPTGPSGPDVSAIVVTSPIDTLIDVAHTVQLAARATDSQGQEISVTGFNWQTSNAAVAVITAAGSLQPSSVGSVTVTAAAGGATGSLRLRIVQADLAGIAAVLDDPFSDTLTLHLSSAIRSNLQSALDLAAGGVSSGNLVDVSEGLESAQGAVAAATTPDDLALAAVLQLLLVHAQSLLSL